MSEFDKQPIQDLYHSIDTVLTERVKAAKTIEVLSDHDGKLLEVVEDNAGKFVRRSYSENGTSAILGRTDFGNYSEAWDYFVAQFQQAGLDVVSSFVIENKDDCVTVVSEYLDQIVEVSELPVAYKVKIAQACAKLIAKNKDEYIVQPQAIREDMFHASPTSDGEFHVVLTDVDPYLSRNFPNIHGYTSGIAKMQIERFVNKINEHWCAEHDREEVLGAFEVALHEELGDMIEEDMELLMIVAKLGMLKHGIEA